MFFIYFLAPEGMIHKPQECDKSPENTFLQCTILCLCAILDLIRLYHIIHVQLSIFEGTVFIVLGLYNTIAPRIQKGGFPSLTFSMQRQDRKLTLS